MPIIRNPTKMKNPSLISLRKASALVSVFGVSLIVALALSDNASKFLEVGELSPASDCFSVEGLLSKIAAASNTLMVA